MARDQVAVIFDVMVPLDGRSRQVPDLGDDSRNGTGQRACQSWIHQLCHVSAKYRGK